MHSHEPRETNNNNFRILLLSLGALILIHGFVLYYIFNYGPLRGVIPYDDCGIILRGLQNLELLARAQTIGEFLTNARHLTIHSPITDFQVLVGLILSDGANWGPYALNIIWPAIALYGLYIATGTKDTWLLAISSIFLLLSPLTMTGMWWLKSDWYGGVLLMTAMYVLFVAAETDRTNLKFVGSVFLALVLLSKMTAFYQPGPVLAVFASFELYSFLKQRESEGAGHKADSVFGAFVHFARTRLWLWIACALIIVGPYCLFFYQSRGHFLYYIDWALSPIWKDHLSVAGRIAHYMPTSTDMRYAWGVLHLQFPILLAIAIAASVLAGRRAHLYLVALLGIVIVIFFAPIIIAQTSDPSYSAVALGAFSGATLVLMGILGKNLPRYGLAIASAVVIILAPFTQLTFTSRNVINGELVRRDEVMTLYRVQKGIASDIAALRPTSLRRIMYTFDDMLAPITNLAIHYFWLTGQFVEIWRIDDLSQDSKAQLKKVNFVISYVPASPDTKLYRLYFRWANSSQPVAADAVVREDGGFRLVKSYPINDGEIRLYEAVTPPAS